MLGDARKLAAVGLIGAALTANACRDESTPASTDQSGGSGPFIAGAPLSRQAQEAGVVRLTPHVVVDRSGWGQPLEAVRLLVPAGWRVSSGVVWYGQGVCGANNAQPVVTMTSPDGRSAIEIGHAMMLTRNVVQANWNAIPDIARGPAQAMVQEAEARGRQMEQQFRGSGDACHVGTAESAQELARRYLLPHRRPAGRIVGVHPAPALAAPLQQAVAAVPLRSGGGIDNRTYVDAAAIDVDYPTIQGDFVERFSFGVMGTRAMMAGLDSGSGPATLTMFDMITTTPIFSVRAPRSQFQAVNAIASAVFSSAQMNPAWTGAMQRLNAELARIRAAGSQATLAAIADRGRLATEARNAISDARMQAWRNGQSADDRMQQGRIDTIYEVAPRVDPATGAQVPLSIHFQGYYSNGRGDYLMTTRAGTNPRDVFPGEDWREMPPAR